MRYDSVTAHSFGPFSGATLEFGQGMNVIYGPNEAGKSSWHSALYMGLCGRTRGRGKQFPVKEFVDRHRPWDRSEWKVSATIRLEDGRRIELTHDLLGKSDSRALDADLGRNYASEIINGGSPDGALWLGLDRRSFLATACVRQTEIQQVVQSSEDLQEYLQRAADTFGADSTAADALGRISDFISENVGQDRRHSTKPLRRAVELVETTTERLERARKQHNEYLVLVSRAGDLEQTKRHLERRLRVSLASRAVRDADGSEEQLLKVRALSERFSAGKPQRIRSDDKLAQAASSALQGWERRPELIDLSGATAKAIQREMDDLPEPPEGELKPAEEVLDAHRAWQQANHEIEFHSRNKPREPEPPETAGILKEELWELAAKISQGQPQADLELKHRLDRLLEQYTGLSRRQRNQRRGLLALGLSLAVTGIVLFLFQKDVLAAGAVFASAVFFGFAFLMRRNRSLKQLQEVINSLKDQVARNEYEIDVATRLREEAVHQLGSRGLPTQADAIRDLVNTIEAVETGRRDLDAWERKRKELADCVASTSEGLRALLQNHGVDYSVDAAAAMSLYEETCSSRKRLAEEAKRRFVLRRQLEDRQRLEAAAAQVENQRLQATEGLRSAARDCGFDEEQEDNETLIIKLREWLTRRGAEIEEHARELIEWGKLENLLGGRTVQELDEDYAKKRRSADALAVEFAPTELLNVVTHSDDLHEYVSLLQEECRNAAADLGEIQGQIRERQLSLIGIPEAEEELGAAKEELERIRGLQTILERTREFLSDAQEQVHRSIAPILREAVKRRLPEVTRGRYQDVLIDPENLRVQVRGQGGELREAMLLSHGTSEQIYLLLRVALAQYLTKPGEVCPLLLDDVTAHSDAERIKAVLQMLHSVSHERQVILFTENDGVLKWAETHLNEPNDRLIRLDPTGVPA